MLIVRTFRRRPSRQHPLYPVSENDDNSPLILRGTLPMGC
jgi:hypothetical protein